MLIIDPNLHNPMVNGIPLMDGDRINRLIGMAKEDLVQGNGIVIEELSNGTIRISADLSDFSGDIKEEYFSKPRDINFLKNMPSPLYKILNPIICGISIDPKFPIRIITKKNNVVSPSLNMIFDVNGNKGSYIDNSSWNVEATMEQTANDSEFGQGGIFTINTTRAIVSDIQIATDEFFTNVILSKTSSLKNVFISFQELETGTYYWRIKSTDINSFDKSFWSTGSFNYTHEEPLYTTECCPVNLTGMSDVWAIESSNWILDETLQASINQNVWNFFSASGFPNEGYTSYFSGEGDLCIKWSRTDGRKMMASSGCRFNFEPFGPGAPYRVFIEGSDDGSSWTSILSAVNDGSQYNNPFSYSFTNNTPYMFLRARFDDSERYGCCYVNKIEVF